MASASRTGIGSADWPWSRSSYFESLADCAVGIRMMDTRQFSSFERINVVGTSGSGKTTFARELAELLNLPFHEMDSLFWKPGWQESCDEELFRRVREVTSKPRWVLDGNYTRTTDVKWDRVQLVIWLDLSFIRTVLRVTKRAVHRSLTGDELWPGTGNRESLRNAFLSKESVIWWSIKSYRKNRSKYEAGMSSPDHSHIQFMRLDSPRSISSCLESLRH